MAGRGVFGARSKALPALLASLRERTPERRLALLWFTTGSGRRIEPLEQALGGAFRQTGGEDRPGRGFVVIGDPVELEEARPGVPGQPAGAGVAVAGLAGGAGGDGD